MQNYPRISGTLSAYVPTTSNERSLPLKCFGFSFSEGWGWSSCHSSPLWYIRAGGWIWANRATSFPSSSPLSCYNGTHLLPLLHQGQSLLSSPPWAPMASPSPSILCPCLQDLKAGSFGIRNWGGSRSNNQHSSLVGRRVLWTVINLDDKANTRMRIIENPDLMEAPTLALCKFSEFHDRRLFQSLSPPLAHKTASGFRIKRLSKGIEIFLSCQICRILTLLSRRRTHPHLCMYSRAGFSGRFLLDLYNSGSRVESQQWA